MKYTREQIKKIKDYLPEKEQRIFNILRETNTMKEVLGFYPFYFNKNKKRCKPKEQKFKECLSGLRKIYRVRCVDIAKEIGCSDDLISKIFIGKRFPTREMLIAISLVMRLPLDAICKLLYLADYPRLYVRELREAAIVHGILHKRSLEEINKTLKDIKEKPIAPFPKAKT